MHRTTLSKDIDVLRAAGIEVMSERKRAMIATKQYCGVSNGSACSSSSYSHSHVLSAMHLPDDRIESAIRISWNGEIDIRDLTDEFSMLLQVVKSFQ